MQLLKAFILFALLILLNLLSANNAFSQFDNVEEVDSFDTPLPTQVRFARAYGGNNESAPPVITLRQAGSSGSATVGSDFVTIELDIDANVPPNVYITFEHCNANWEESDNVFLMDLVNLRTSHIDWHTAPYHGAFYSYRGILKVPNNQIKFKHSGNWKAKIFEYYSDDLLAEIRFFVVQPLTQTAVMVTPDFYNPKFRVTNTSINLDAIVMTQENLFDHYMHTAVLYRNGRFSEPYVVTNSPNVHSFEEKYRYRFFTNISGFANYEKRFRISGIPAENEYRVLNMTNPALFPRSSTPIRLPLSDVRRNGNYMYRDDDGVLITSFVSNFDDDYVPIEFLLDPEGLISNDDVFISGSFNNWNPTKEWQMYYDEKDRYYKCVAYVRRGRHNYLYATGTFDFQNNRVLNYSYDEYEGNTSYDGHTWYAFIYYKFTELGGYDGIIGVGSSKDIIDFRRRR